jgi:hypothetical protein
MTTALTRASAARVHDETDEEDWHAILVRLGASGKAAFPLEVDDGTTVLIGTSDDYGVELHVPAGTSDEAMREAVRRAAVALGLLR